MEIRPAHERDIPAIVELLKLSLGESLMPKSEAFWRWKHIDNPFGKSPVLLAFEGNQLIGVRAFMRWEWKQGNTLYKAVRAVDTATHPEHQGKGIFKKLTLQLVDQCRKEGVHFIFNTPNKSSKPGYIKMGWRELGKLNVYIAPRLSFQKRNANYDKRYALSDQKLAEHSEPIGQLLQAENHTNLSTHRSLEFLKWRYAVNPNIPYYLHYNEAITCVIIFRLKSTKAGTEFRICEVLNQQGIHTSGIRAILREAVRASGASFISSVSRIHLFPSIQLAVGPLVTINHLHENISLSFDTWKPTLGDMEVF
ncbi:MAG: GNAT family N-acetyltransferase [Cyclobacteriaceae bacterium]|nr:GNAT family N-acetyltransferase [Cyclobacteriaceae bacterium]